MLVGDEINWTSFCIMTTKMHWSVVSLIFIMSMMMTSSSDMVLHQSPIRWQKLSFKVCALMLYAGAEGLQLEVNGKWPKGRPKQCWLDTLKLFPFFPLTWKCEGRKTIHSKWKNAYICGWLFYSILFATQIWIQLQNNRINSAFTSELSSECHRNLTKGTIQN